MRKVELSFTRLIIANKLCFFGISREFDFTLSFTRPLRKVPLTPASPAAWNPLEALWRLSPAINSPAIRIYWNICMVGFAARKETLGFSIRALNSTSNILTPGVNIKKNLRAWKTIGAGRQSWPCATTLFSSALQFREVFELVARSYDPKLRGKTPRRRRNAGARTSVLTAPRRLKIIMIPTWVSDATSAHLAAKVILFRINWHETKC